MTHIYKISGMTCGNCKATVGQALESIQGVQKVDIDLQNGRATINMNRHVETTELKNALKHHPKYQLTEENTFMHPSAPMHENGKTWFTTFKPIILIFAYILITTLLVEYSSGNFLWMRWLDHLMAGFFLTFSFFKLLDLDGFADTYSTYDIIARRWRPWGYIYAFVELGLGLAFLTGIYPMLTNAVTFIVMSVSLIGVLQSVMNKRQIRCACLGTIFNLPMTTITIIEDALMIAMSGLMLIKLF